MSLPSARADGEPISYRDVARGGLDAVLGEAAGGDWAAAADRAREVKRVFRDAADLFGPVPGDAFDGLLAACIARDADELGDFAELVEELFP